MSSASLAVSSRARPDPVRIAALSATMALNLAAFLAAVRPQAPTDLASVVSQVTLPVHWIERVKPRPVPPPPPPPPPPDLKRLPRHAPSLPHATPVAMSPPVPSPTSQDRLPALVSPPSSTAVPAATPAAATPVEASLAYRAAPLSYPHTALRQHMQGTVLLRVLVDEGGRPIDVVILRSSGYILLDRSAREQVLAGWRFAPAMSHGQAVRAWARVPVSFALRAY
jgi:protein TonB